MSDATLKNGFAAHRIFVFGEKRGECFVGVSIERDFGVIVGWISGLRWLGLAVTAVCEDEDRVAAWDGIAL